MLQYFYLLLLFHLNSTPHFFSAFLKTIAFVLSTFLINLVFFIYLSKHLIILSFYSLFSLVSLYYLKSLASIFFYLLFLSHLSRFFNFLSNFFLLHYKFQYYNLTLLQLVHKIDCNTLLYYD